MKKREYIAARGIEGAAAPKRDGRKGRRKNFLINTIVRWTTAISVGDVAVVTCAQTGSTPLNAGHCAKNGRCNKACGKGLCGGFRRGIHRIDLRWGRERIREEEDMRKSDRVADDGRGKRNSKVCAVRPVCAQLLLIPRNGSINETVGQTNLPARATVSRRRSVTSSPKQQRRQSEKEEGGIP